MRILLVVDPWDYGDRERGHSFEWDTFYRTLVADGHDVYLFDIGIARHLDERSTERTLRQALSQHDTQLVFCVLFEDEIAPSTLASIKDGDGIPVANWFCDDHWRYEDFSRKFAPSLTLSVTTSSLAAAKYARDGFPYLMSQWGYADKSYGALPPPRDANHNIVFVGQPYGPRKGILQALEGSLPPGSELKKFGFGTPDGRVTSQEMIGLFNKSSASINFSSSWQPNLLGRLRRRRLFRHRVPPQLKARVFEVTGAGGVLLTEPSEDLTLYFEIGKEILIFHDIHELAELACRAIDDPGWRFEIARAGFDRCHSEHTMSQRLEQVLRACTS